MLIIDNLTLQSLLCGANPSSPASSEAALIFSENNTKIVLKESVEQI